MAFCVNRNLVTGMPPSVSKAVTNQNDLVTGKVLYFSLWKIRRVIPAKTSLADNPDLKSDNRNNRSFSVDGLRLGITVDNMKRMGFRSVYVSNVGEVGLKNKCSQTTEPQLFYIVCCGHVLLF